MGQVHALVHSAPGPKPAWAIEALMVTLLSSLAALLAVPAALAAEQAGQARVDTRTLLREGWVVQSSAEVKAGGEAISTPAFKPEGWHRATIPATVVAALVADGTYPDPHFGMNLRQIPGTTYPVGKNFSNLPLPADSPFRIPWWYRTEFALPMGAIGRTAWLRFEGVNFRANVWLNGHQVADASATAGAFRISELDVTGWLKPGVTNVLAVEVFPPETGDLAITFVDWNPMPPDKLMGIYRDVSLVFSGPVALRHPQVLTRLSLATLDRAELTVKATLRNASGKAVAGRLEGRIEGVRFGEPVSLGPGESREVRLEPKDHAELVFLKPRLWWPWELGAPETYPLELEFIVNGAVSDRLVARFGIREFASAMTEAGHLVFKVNGRRILVRGAGYTPEMTLRTEPDRQEAEIRYVKDMHLNTIRLEGKLEDDHFFDVADREGILVMAGWCCCDHWERWGEWKAEDHTVAAASQRDQILRLRTHPSVLAWFNGSDNPPPAPVEKMYLDILGELEWPNPVVSSATGQPGPVSGPSGMKMNGPYEYVPPIYWQWDKKRGGAFGFATEIGPGPAVPPLESLKRMLPADHLWPIDAYWDFHAGGGEFKDLRVFTTALEKRYGPATGVEDYARKAQAAAYESHRAMFEAYGQNKYVSTGVIQWMLNNAWPSMIWHLYDFYLRPGGSYFGTKKACEPLHVQYSYDDRSVVVVNSFPRAFDKMKVTARVFDLTAKELYARSEIVDVAPDSSRKVFALPEPSEATPTYFAKLSLQDADGNAASDNFYWLSAKPDALDDGKAKWYFTPMSAYADLTGLARLPQAKLEATVRNESQGGDGRVRVTLDNPSPHLAFLVALSLRQGPGGAEVLPILWQDSYVSLLPGERREIDASYALKDLAGQPPVVRLEGWNVAPMLVPEEPEPR